MSRIKFSEKINIALKEQGRSKAWLADKLGIHQQSMYKKMRENTFSISDIVYIGLLLEIKED